MTINRTKINDKTKKLVNNKPEEDKKKYCLFFNRFGRCSRGSDCPYVHDKKRVALCPRLFDLSICLLIISLF